MCEDDKSKSSLQPNSNSLPLIDKQRRHFLWLTTKLLTGIGAFYALKPFISSWLPSARVNAESASTHVDISQLMPGQQMTVMWRGKPIWIVYRTPAILAQLRQPNSKLRDPNSYVEQQPPYAKNYYRSINPRFLVLIGVCTHLGCIPIYKPTNGQKASYFHCPCHGSNFDLAGRVFKGAPAPINLAVPPHRFITETVIIIG
jgi:ubiquinol-cytochrome c reductase iron-sulfur subunit